MQINEVLANNWRTIDVEYSNFNDVLKDIPSQPGIYKIRTNTTKEILREFGARKDPKHYNLRKKVIASDAIPNSIKITQQANSQYVVYSGHSFSLKQRFREHFRGSKGTGCLALFQLEKLRDFKWSFQFISLNEVAGYNDSKLYRTYLEQHQRINMEWPILCSQ
ncbi:hypothetical protein [Aquimarina agarilytica]|uniref:hypothetical protein n=1 Tax=Aquimarina agarilytica TaxID=1087449 RepID=UPI000289FE96|nr:hypothetical protein [Aquimarina agarilytica]